MVIPTDADRVWNRACFSAEDWPQLERDVALKAMIVADGLINNGGVLHAAESLGAEGAARACAAFDYFGIAGVSDLLREARALVDIYDAIPDDQKTEPDDDDEHRTNAAYGSLAPEGTLMPAFQRHFESHPDRYAPLGPLTEDDLGEADPSFDSALAWTRKQIQRH